jgi:hypothetical protein
VFVATGGAPSRILVYQRSGSSWRECFEYVFNGECLAASVDFSRNRCLAATHHREFMVVDLGNGSVKSVEYQKQPGAQIHGRVALCCFSRDGDEGLFAMGDGSMSKWNWQSGGLLRMSNYRGLTEHELITLLRPTADGEGIMIATTVKCWIANGTADGGPRAGHLVAVNACCITASGHVASASAGEKTLRWFDCDELKALGRHAQLVPISAMYASGGEDELYLGNYAGHVWRQALYGEPEPAGQFSGPINSLFVERDGTLFVATEDASIARHNPARSNQGSSWIWKGNGFQQQVKLLPAGRHGLCWSVRFDQVVGGRKAVMVLLTAPQRQQHALPGDFRFETAVVSPNRERICLIGRTLKVFAFDSAWREIARIEKPATCGEFLDDDHLAVALAEEPWIEIIAVTSGRTVAAFRTSSRVRCIAVRMPRIVLGLESGDLVSLKRRGTQPE